MRKRISGRYALALALVGILGLPAVATGFGEGNPLKLGKRNPSSNPTRDLTRETEIIADLESYGTRQSNKRVGRGGGAIYGCRAAANTEQCVRAVNLSNGRAFGFETNGAEGGRIEVGDVNGRPLTTNAKGVATGFNADQVDGKDAADLDDAETLGGKKATDFAASGDLLFAAVSAAGALGANRGATAAAAGAGNTYTVTFAKDVSKCSYTASAVGGASVAGLGVQSGPQSAQVVVDTGPSPSAFHLQVIC